MKKRTSQRTALRHFALPAFQEQLAKKHFYQTSFYSNSFPAETSNKTAFSQQLARRELQNRNFSDSSFENRTFRQAASQTAA